MRCSMHTFCSFGTAAVLTTTSAFADTLHVPADYPTIQAAIDAASDGCTVVVADGTYTGDGNRDLDFGGKAITVRGENDPGPCVIDIQASEVDPHRAFWFRSGETAESVVEGFTIQNGFMNRGGAVLCENSSPLFRACVFQQNTASQEAADDGGGAVYNLTSSPTFVDCGFEGNQAEVIFLYGGGGAVHNQSDSSPTFSGCTFSGNTAFPEEQQPDGGAVAIWDGGHPEFYSCTFAENQAFWDGAVYCSSSVTMHDCHFQGNVAAGSGGAYGQDDYLFGGGSSTFVNCSFIGSSALGVAGGAVRLQGDRASMTLTNCVFADNQTMGTSNGGAMMVRDGADVTLTNCTLAKNTAAGIGGAIRIHDGSSATVDNCVLWDNLPNQISVSGTSSWSVDYSDIQGGWPGIGNLAVDPLFVDPDAGDFRLRSGSPCLDAGDSTVVPAGIETDLDGNPRFVDDPEADDTGNPDGVNSQVDMGPYEFCRADVNFDGQVNVADLTAKILDWGTDGSQFNGDVDGSGMIDVDDLTAVILNWGPCG
jgi:hypothetical protein